MDTEWYSKEELKSLGFKKIGSDAKISRSVKIYGFTGTIGSKSRIDDYTILKGNIDIGSYVHISSFCYFAAVGSYIKIGKLTGISARTSIFAVTDDFIGDYLTNPTVNKKFRNIIKGDVLIGNNISIGANSLILPDIKIADHSSIAAFSIINKNILKKGSIYGNNIKTKKIYQKNIDRILKKQKKFLKKL